jgi:hypothetical protein
VFGTSGHGRLDGLTDRSRKPSRGAIWQRHLRPLRLYTETMAEQRNEHDAKEAAAASVAGRVGAASLTGRAAEDHRSQALSAADCAERVLALFEGQYPGDDRPRKAIEAARAWARGEIRVSEARAAALEAHAAARATSAHPAAVAAARSAGHAAATAHMAGHARHAEAYAAVARTRGRDA